MKNWLKKIETWPKPLAAAVSIASVLLVALGDYLTGYRAFFFVFYLVPLALAAWRVGISFGVAIAALSVVSWQVTSVLAGGHDTDSLIMIWNSVVIFGLYVAMVAMFRLYLEVEDRVRERTAALTREMKARQRLEKELLEAGEREQRRIAHDLHDSLCQHLTGTALAGQVLEKKLSDKSSSEAAAAGHVVDLVEEAIDLTRSIARGLHPIQMQAVEIGDHFEDLASQISARFNVLCHFECPQPVPLRDPDIITHLYRIAQEAVTNAVRHGKARRINICLDAADGEIVLTVTDDGVGFSEERVRRHEGMGLHIMAYRAGMIGAAFNIENLPAGGTRVTCSLPASAEPAQNHASKN